MGWNSWTSFGCGVSADKLRATADFFIANGLAAAGFTSINSDDCWMNSTRDASGRLQANLDVFPGGISNISSYLHSKGLQFGIYSAASSVVCSGHPGSLYNEFLDAQSFVEWGCDYVKYDNCGEYGLGPARFTNFADAVNATGSRPVISTEPFDLIPGPQGRSFANLWRTGNDISASWNTIIDRIDRNDKWAPFAGPGGWNDPDMLQVGNGGLTDAECRAHFGLWALAKSPLVIGANVDHLTPSQLAILLNKDIIGVNQDPLGVQARKLAVNGVPPPKHVGLAPCSTTATLASGGGYPGANGVTAASLQWALLPLPPVNGTQTAAVFNNETGWCLTVGAYAAQAAVPLLAPCNASDPAQAWLLPTGAQRLGGLLNAAAPPAASALAVGNTTLYGQVHGDDPIAALDAAYGAVNLTLAGYAPEPACHDRNCQDYAPEQMWYWSPRTGQLALGLYAANMYRCFYGPCYRLSTHIPATEQLCLAHVLSISNDGTDPATTSTPGVDVWGGPLGAPAPGSFVVGLFNRDAVPRDVTARWAMLGAPGVGDGTPFCVKELYNGTALGVLTGGATLTVGPHDLAVLRLVPDVTTC